MSLREMSMWTIDCDRCGTNVDRETDYAGWADKDGAVNSADGDGWLITDSGEYYCHDCVMWDEEKDERVPLPPREVAS